METARPTLTVGDDAGAGVTRPPENAERGDTTEKVDACGVGCKTDVTV